MEIIEGVVENTYRWTSTMDIVVNPDNINHVSLQTVLEPLEGKRIRVEITVLD